MYPTNTSDLKAMIDAEWPDVRTSSMAVELYDPNTLQFLQDRGRDGYPKSQKFAALVHRVVGSCGLEVEGMACDNAQLFFTEEEAVRALWHQYNKLTPVSDLNTDSKGVLFCWRMEPSITMHHGTYSAVMRYSCLWRDRFGEIVPSWTNVTSKAA